MNHSHLWLSSFFIKHIIFLKGLPFHNRQFTKIHFFISSTFYSNCKNMYFCNSVSSVAFHLKSPRTLDWWFLYWCNTVAVRGHFCLEFFRCCKAHKSIDDHIDCLLVGLVSKQKFIWKAFSWEKNAKGFDTKIFKSSV